MIRSFVDTNVLVYAHARQESEKQRIAKALLADLWRAGAGVVSTQILAEFYATLTRKAAISAPRHAARELVRQYSRWSVILIQPADVTHAAEVEEEAQINFWDALMIVAAERSGAARLLTEDLHHGQTLLGVRIENPFRRPN